MNFLCFANLHYLIIYSPQISESIWHLSFTYWLISPGIITSNSIHFIPKALFPLTNSYIIFHWVCIPQFQYPVTCHWTLSFFPWCGYYNTIMDIGMHIGVFIFFMNMKDYCWYFYFYFSRYLHAVFHESCMKLNTHRGLGYQQPLSPMLDQSSRNTPPHPTPPPPAAVGRGSGRVRCAVGEGGL